MRTPIEKKIYFTKLKKVICPNTFKECFIKVEHYFYNDNDKYSFYNQFFCKNCGLFKDYKDKLL